MDYVFSSESFVTVCVSHMIPRGKVFLLFSVGALIACVIVVWSVCFGVCYRSSALARVVLVYRP